MNTINDTSTVAGTGGPRARRTDPEESHLAADTSNLAESQDAVLEALATGPRTDGDIVRHHYDMSLFFGGPKFSDSRLRTARHELVEAGLVENSGIPGSTPSGRKCATWQKVSS